MRLVAATIVSAACLIVSIAGAEPAPRVSPAAKGGQATKWLNQRAAATYRGGTFRRASGLQPMKENPANVSLARRGQQVKVTIRQRAAGSPSMITRTGQIVSETQDANGWVRLDVEFRASDPPRRGAGPKPIEGDTATFAFGPDGAMRSTGDFQVRGDDGQAIAPSGMAMRRSEQLWGQEAGTVSQGF